MKQQSASEFFLPHSVPRYQLLAEQLIEGIVSGTYQVDKYLPTEAMLRQQYQVSRFTVREAVKLLQKKGLVVTRRGVGSQVISRDIEANVYAFSSVSLTHFLNNAIKTRLYQISTEYMACDSDLAKVIACIEGKKLLKISARRVAIEDSSLIVGYTHIYVLEIYSGIRKHLGKRITISKTIEMHFGVSPIEIHQQITPIIIEAKLAKKLKVAEGIAGMKVIRSYIGNDGKCFLYVINYHAGEQAELTMKIHKYQ